MHCWVLDLLNKYVLSFSGGDIQATRNGVYLTPFSCYFTQRVQVNLIKIIIN